MKEWKARVAHNILGPAGIEQVEYALDALTQADNCELGMILPFTDNAGVSHILVVGSRDVKKPVTGSGNPPSGKKRRRSGVAV